jgi:hypothetical protein
MPWLGFKNSEEKVNRYTFFLASPEKWAYTLDRRLGPGLTTATACGPVREHPDRDFAVSTHFQRRI